MRDPGQDRAYAVQRWAVACNCTCLSGCLYAVKMSIVTYLIIMCITHLARDGLLHLCHWNCLIERKKGQPILKFHFIKKEMTN